MKKFLRFLSMATLLILPGSLLAQNILDDFDDYELGAVSPQADHWITWGAGADDANVVDEEFYSAPHSLRLAEGGVEDVLLLLGANHSASTHRVGFRIMVPEGKTGFYNHQLSQTPGVGWNVNVRFNQDAMAPGIGLITDGNEAPLSTFDYTPGEWMLIEHVIDFDTDVMNMYVNNELVYTMPYAFTLGAINFYSIDANNLYYVDDIFFGEVEEAECDPGEELIICDNFESYQLDSYMASNADHWDTWSSTPGGAEDAMVSNDFASSGLHSMGVFNGGVQDMILLLGDRTEGEYRLKWDMYIPDSAAAYYNIQQNGGIGVAWVLDVFFNENGDTPGIAEIDGLPDTFEYPVDQWFEVEHYFNLDNSTISLTIDGTEVASFIMTETGIGAANFYSLNEHVTTYIDDVEFAYMGSSVGIADLEESPFELYPNPASDVLFVKSSVTDPVDLQLLNINGQQISYETLTGNTLHQVNVSGLSPGVYMLRLVSNNAEHIHKLVVR